MNNPIHSGRERLHSQVKWLIVFRSLFVILLIISCAIFSTSQDMPVFSRPFIDIYKVCAAVLCLTIVYLICLNQSVNSVLLTYVQVIIDTICVTIIIHITGSYESVFTFLYLVVIIYTSMLLLQKGSLIIAAVSSVQYGLLIELEYYNIVSPYMDQLYIPDYAGPSQITYKVLSIIAACFAVAVLSGVLASQLKGARQDLKLAQEHLKRVDRMAMMDELISGIAHEIKNPLASLSGSIQLLQEDTSPGSYEDKLMQIILRETDRLKDIVTDIRLFSKPSTKNAHEIQMSEAIEETVELFKNDPKWNQKISISMNLDKNIFVTIDPAHLNQILWNLLKNAAQSIENAGQINLSLRSSKSNRVYFTISDTGCGIEAKSINQVFDPFYTTKPDGTGLGLSIIHRLIDTYNGMIDFESTPGKGTTFTILFNGAPV